MTHQKQLFIVRHGKSSWKYETVDDIDRPLKEKGIIDSYTVAGRLKERKLSPQLIISSPAVRAMHTAGIFARTLEYPMENMKIHEDFYEAYEQTILEHIKTTDNSIESVMIVGHNPTFTNLANRFLPESLSKLPTAGIAVISFDADTWQNIYGSNVQEVFIEYPKKKN